MTETAHFNTEVSGIPCGVVVDFYREGLPMRITGWGFGDADPPEPAEMEWHLIDRKGYRAEWLERKLMPDEVARIERQIEREAGKVEI
jgi:hypothetical protein